MKTPRLVCMLLLVLGLAGAARPEGAASFHQDPGPVTIRVGKLLDGRGGSMSDVTIVLDGSRIQSIESKPRENPTWDLSGLTLMPGGIDTHVHLGWHFGRNGMLYDEDNKAQKETPAEIALHAAENAVATVRSGITTVQSLGGPEDAPLRDAIARGILPGPRVLTSLEPLRGDRFPREDARGGRRPRLARGGRDQDLRLQEHPRRRCPDADP
jgi:imidazolonepropionase-like amidohydrolase